ncbi:alpha/beta hydrolase [Chitinophaga filiformis]|uniref:Alpha/beta hydrolase n=1 Tax=Chitinophaga filiformis TaxID=104663 RepID=A0ABY4I8L9_CHIFI|nr:alpha/beta hydrolase [Chitinophaga filiformis]UPK72439.1 alpha/beta hydrolase [Chitinophaga filiformis]
MRKMYMGLTVLFFSYQHMMAQQSMPLYPANQIPFAKENTEQPKITVYVPQKKKSDVAVIVCSGGAYGGRANDVEGIPACRKLNEAGITAFLLDYRVPDASRMTEKEIVPLTDVQATIMYVRSHAKQYGIKPDKVGIMGFSAGGHLVTTVETHFNQTRLDNPGHISLRPDFVVAVYPVVSFADSLTHIGSRRNLIGPDITPEKIREYSNELQVTEETPPTFLVSAIDDDVVKVENSLYLEAALRQHHVPVKMFLYAKGGHGFGVNNRTASAQWTEPCIRWILSGKWKADF